MSIDLISTKIDFLESIGCGKTMHSGRTLLEHLIGVYKVLDEGFATLHVCDAGLFHSVYGTAYFKPKTISLDKRDIVKEIIGKGGAEGIQCICKVNEGIGLALKVEDGSKRAKHAVSLHLLKQLEWISDLRIQDIDEKVFNFSEGVRIEVKGQLKFQES